MTDDRYRRVRDLFHATCDLDTAGRNRFLSEHCGADKSLRAEVEALLACDGDEDDAFAETELGATISLLQLDSSPTGKAASAGDASHGKFLPGTTVAGRYRIVSRIGQGGMGDVYRADDLQLTQAVALKFLPDEFAADPIRLEYFRNEVRLARTIAHRNVCRVYDIGEVAGQYFLSMEYVDGEDLRHLLRRIGRLPADKGVDIARQLCLGLAAAHEKGVIHRDLKPSNVMIDGEGHVRITDFGLARPASDHLETGDFAGTPAYMAPEQLARGETSERSDLYALGLILYELFTGESGFQAGSFEELRRVRGEFALKPPSSVVAGIDPLIDRVVVSCLRADPTERPRSAYTVASALPGGDPIEAALAMGETPSPAMLAASGEGKGLSRKAGSTCLAASLIGIVCVAALSGRLQEAIGFDADGILRPDEAGEMLRRLGYDTAGVDRVWGVEWSEDYFVSVRDNEPVVRLWETLTGKPPTAATFWYRAYQGSLVPRQGRGPYSSMLVTRDDPPRLAPGMASLLLDARGRLLELVVFPRSERAAQPEERGLGDTWRERLLEAAGIEAATLEARFRPIEEPFDPPPPVYADRFERWESGSGALRLEMASYEGRPVYFRFGPQREAAPVEAHQAFGIALAVAVLSVFLTGLVLAWRNLRSGRADRRGAGWLFLVVVGTSLAHWALRANHVVGIGELTMLLQTLARALLRGVFLCAAYLGLEPYVRRVWPHRLVSWSRLLAGHFHDPIVGRDLLVGITCAVVLQVLGSLGYFVDSGRKISLVADPHVRVDAGPFPLEPLLGPLDALGQLFGELLAALVGGLIVSLLFVYVLRLVLRRETLAVVAFVLFYSLPSVLRGDFVSALTVALLASSALFLSFRFGALSVMVAWIGWRTLSWPVDLDTSSPRVDLGLLACAVAAGVACYAFYAATRRSPAAPRGSPPSRSAVA